MVSEIAVFMKMDTVFRRTYLVVVSSFGATYIMFESIYREVLILGGTDKNLHHESHAMEKSDMLVYTSRSASLNK